MKVTELRQALKAMDLKTTGTKLALAKRLKNALLKYAGAVQVNKSEGGSRSILDHGFEFSDDEWIGILKVDIRKHHATKINFFYEQLHDPALY